MSLRRTIITLSVLHDDQYGGPGPGDMELEALAYEGTDGEFVIHSEVAHVEELSGKEMADALIAANSDPSFFLLNPDGTRED